ncbi:MAG: LysM peptidoglycan-binding domain-containing protein [Actinobacteria bacterium]|nr:LysM peptidoglycan-binding domain-containing protein [Actinomycetota bacterium]
MSASHITLVPAPIHSERVGRSAGVTPHGKTRLRITRRGRIVLGTLITLLVVALLAVAATLGASRAIASNEAGGPDFGYVVVQPGDTLWSVATELDPSSDPRDVISEIVRLNQLGGSDVQAGQAIAVPLRYSDAPGVVSGAELGIDA